MLLCNKGGKCCLEIAAKTGSSDVAMTIVKHKRLVATDVITQFRRGINRVGTKLAVNIILTHNEHDLQKFHQNAKVGIDQIMDTYAMSTAVKWVRMLKPRARAWEWIAPFPKKQAATKWRQI